MNIREEDQENGSSGKKRKRPRLLLDARIELTDEELKVHPGFLPVLTH
jgi:hypothetical protein